MRLLIPERFRPLVETNLDGHEAAWYGDQESALGAVPRAEVLWLNTWRSPEIEALLAAGEQLRWVFTHSAGVESYPLERFRERGIPLTNGAGLHALPIAEYVVLGMLAAAKGFPELVRAQDRRTWLEKPPGFFELAGSKALVLGFAAVPVAVMGTLARTWPAAQRSRVMGTWGAANGIGQAIGERLTGLQVEVTGVRRRDGDSWRERLGDFDWVILALPVTRESRHIIGAPELRRMRPTAWIVNIARGPLIDQPALIEALQAKRIGGAYLDVTDPEPLPAESPLWTLPNVIVTPHSSWASRRSDERAAALFLENLGRLAAGAEMRNLVDLSAGY